MTLIAAVVLAAAVASPPPAREAVDPAASPLRAYALRLRPGQDLRQELLRFAREHQLRSAAVLSCVGSLTRAVVRYADQPAGTSLSGRYEIVSLVGTLTLDGAHLHVALADRTGVTLGGHLLDGSAVYTTAEIVLGELPALVFAREHDPESGYDELVVRPRP